MGTIAGIVTGSVVFYINIEHGFWPAFASFLKQFFFNLLMAGYNTKSCEKLARKIKNNFIGIITPTIIPTLQSFIVLYAIHYFGGTPKPMASTLWQAFPNFGFFFFMTLIYRGKLNILNNDFYKITDMFKIRTRIKEKRAKKMKLINNNTKSVSKEAV